MNGEAIFARQTFHKLVRYFSLHARGAAPVAACTAGALLSTGCGAITAGLNPRNVWAAQEKAPLTVVVHRADAASTTATEVGRLLVATPTAKDSEWTKQTQLAAGDIDRVHKGYAEHPYYEGKNLQIVPAIVWASVLPAIKGDTGASSSLLAAMSSDLGDGYAQLQAKITQVGTLEGQLKTEEAALDRKDITDADKQAHTAAIASLKAQIEAAKNALEPAKKAYVESCRVAAAKVPGDVRDRYGIALVNLRQAVDDAEGANGAAVVRYPFVVYEVASAPAKLKDVLFDVAKASASDYLFAQTGKRLHLGPPVQWGLTYEGGNVGVTINGLGTNDLGTLPIDQLVLETITRTQKFAVEALALLAITSATQELLAFEQDVLDAILGGFASTGWGRPEPAHVAALDSIQIRAGVSGTSRPGGIMGGLPSLPGFGK
jgi:hypothetical protein